MTAMLDRPLDPEFRDPEHLFRDPEPEPTSPVRKALIRKPVWLIVALVVLGMLYVGFMANRGAEKVVVEQQAAQTQSQLQQVADPVAAQCASDATVRARLGEQTCNAAAVAVAGAQGPAGPIGATGPTGDPGKGIVATVIRNDGHLIVSYSDGSKVDAGPVVGKEGADGKSITASGITNGHLILTFSDGTVSDLGTVVGEKGATGSEGTPGPAGAPGVAGRGIANTQIVDGRLIVTYDDQTTSDAGAVPAGPAGANGSPAESFTMQLPGGGTQQCTRNGGEDTAPIYQCDAE